MTTHDKAMPKPKLTIETSSKFYLATALRKDDQMPELVFVYALFLQRDKNGRYPIQTYTETHTFDNANDANVYYRTLSDIIKCNQRSPLGQSVQDMCAAAVKNFNQMTR